MGIAVKMVNNMADITKARDEQIKKALIAIGKEAATNAKKECPVDTGRLRNSIAYATMTADEAKYVSGEEAPKEWSEPHASPKATELYVGTNCEYAARQEEGNYEHNTGNKHFLRNSVSSKAYTDRYKKILEAALKT